MNVLRSEHVASPETNAWPRRVVILFCRGRRKQPANQPSERANERTNGNQRRYFASAVLFPVLSSLNRKTRQANRRSWKRSKSQFSVNPVASCSVCLSAGRLSAQLRRTGFKVNASVHNTHSYSLAVVFVERCGSLFS